MFVTTFTMGHSIWMGTKLDSGDGWGDLRERLRVGLKKLSATQHCQRSVNISPVDLKRLWARLKTSIDEIQNERYNRYLFDATDGGTE
jgi:hypothetical protein